MQICGYRCSIIALDFIIYYDYKCSYRYCFQTPVKFQYLKEGFLMRVCVYIWVCPYEIGGFPSGTSGKEPACQCRSRKRHHQFDPWIRRTPWRRKCNSLQYSCLENSMNRGAWWATVHGVTKSWTQPKQLSSMKSNFLFLCSPIVHTPHICTPLISPFGLQVLMASFPLKNQVFINFAKDQKCYETADTSSQGSTVSTDSQDDRL